MKSPEGVLVIGITGNIGVGKSVVRRMLERLGALGIDADALTHRVLLKDSPVYARVMSEFGKKILGDDGAINRQTLAERVFNDKKSLQVLENLIHPAVGYAIRHIIEDSTSSLIAIEAIKLLESDLVDLCDTVWLVDAPRQEQLDRILGSRPLTVDQVQDRLDHQTQMETKRRMAQVIINNRLGLENTWNQVIAAMEKNEGEGGRFKNRLMNAMSEQKSSPEFRYLLPHQSADLDDFFTRLIPDEPDSSWARKCSPQPLTGNKLKEILNLDRFKLLTNYAGAIHAGYSLGLINSENFLMEPLFFHQAEPQIMDDLPEWLTEMEGIARQHLSEAVIFPLKKSRLIENEVLQENGFSVLSHDSFLWQTWKDQSPKNHPTGYNVLSKTLRRTVTFE